MVSTINIRRRLDSDTLPEVQPFIGKIVSITVREVIVPVVTAGTGDWTTWPACAADMDGYDFDALRKLRGNEVLYVAEPLSFDDK